MFSEALEIASASTPSLSHSRSLRSRTSRDMIGRREGYISDIRSVMRMVVSPAVKCDKAMSKFHHCSGETGSTIMTLGVPTSVPVVFAPPPRDI